LNVLEAAIAITAGILAGSIALVGFGLDRMVETVAAVALYWRLRAELTGSDGPEMEKMETRPAARCGGRGRRSLVPRRSWPAANRLRAASTPSFSSRLLSHVLFYLVLPPLAWAWACAALEERLPMQALGD